MDLLLLRPHYGLSDLQCRSKAAISPNCKPQNQISLPCLSALFPSYPKTLAAFPCTSSEKQSKILSIPPLPTPASITLTGSEVLSKIHLPHPALTAQRGRPCAPLTTRVSCSTRLPQIHLQETDPESMAIKRVNQKPNSSARTITLLPTAQLAKNQGRSYLTYDRKSKSHRVNGPNPDLQNHSSKSDPKPRSGSRSRSKLPLKKPGQVNLTLQITDHQLPTPVDSDEEKMLPSRIVKVSGTAVPAKTNEVRADGRPKIKLRLKIPKGFSMDPLRDCVVSPVYPEVDKADCIPFPDFEESMREYEALKAEEELERWIMEGSDAENSGIERAWEMRGRKRGSEFLSESVDHDGEEKRVEEREGKRRRRALSL